MILFRPSVEVYTLAARHEELLYCKGLDAMPDDFCLLLARSGLALRYRHASRRVSQRSLSCEIVSNPPFVAFRYSEGLHRRELTGGVCCGSQVADWPSVGSSLTLFPWREVGHSPPSCCLVNEWVERYLHSLICLLCRATKMFLKMVGVQPRSPVFDPTSLSIWICGGRSGIATDFPFPVAWGRPPTSILLPSQWMSGSIPPLSYLPCMSCTLRWLACNRGVPCSIPRH